MKAVCNSHTGSKRQSWDLNLGRSASSLSHFVFAACYCCPAPRSSLNAQWAFDLTHQEALSSCCARCTLGAGHTAHLF